MSLAVAVSWEVLLLLLLLLLLGRRLASAVQVALASLVTGGRFDSALLELMHGAHKSL